jgi:hypothetical protein
VRNIWVVVAVAACGVALAAGLDLILTHGRARPSTPSVTPVRLNFTPGSGYADSGVVRRAGSAWLATASGTTNVANQVRVYRWKGAGWALVGVVDVPALPSISEGGGFVTAVSLTRSGAPDFTLNTFGADTHWFSVIALLRGKWRLVPFDYGHGTTTAIDAWGTNDHLVRAETNGCGCASGPETYTWYRFESRIFVPTEPPSGPAACTIASLTQAASLPYAPQLSPFDSPRERQQFRAPLSIARFACSDGWALATTRGGSIALFEQRNANWLRDLVGPAKEIRAPQVGFAIPDSLLWTLASRVGVSLGRRPTASHYNVNGGSYRPPAWERGAVSVPVTPGSSYVDTRVVYRQHQKWFAIALEPSRAIRRHHNLDVYVYRWRDGSWALDGTVSADFTTPHPEGPVFWPNQEWVGGTAPGFSFSPGVSSGEWTLVISREGGTWHVLPFHTALGGDAATVEVDHGTRTHFYSYVSPHRYGIYRYRNGALVSGAAQADPTCDRQNLVPSRWTSPKVACGYGWALVTGTTRGRQKVDVFRAVGSHWRSWLVESARSIPQLTTDIGIPPWELAQLAPNVR